MYVLCTMYKHFISNQAFKLPFYQMHTFITGKYLQISLRINAKNTGLYQGGTSNAVYHQSSKPQYERWKQYL